MTFDQVRAAIGDQLVWAVIAAGFALIGTLLAAVSVVQQRDGSGPTVGLAAGPALGVAAVAGLGWAAVLGGPQSAAADPASTECSVTTYAIVYLVAPLLVGPSLLTAIAAGAFAGARTPPRRVGVGLAVAAAGLGAGIAVTVGGIAAHDPLYPVVRAVVYAGIALGAGLAASGGSTAGRTAAVAVLPLVVAVGEGSHRGLVTLLLVHQAAVVVRPDQWAEGLAQMRAAVAPEAAAAGLALALATVPGALVARGVGAPTWIVASIVAAVSLFGSDLGPARLTALASLHRDAPPVDPADPAD